jgi:hypothetical protein
MAAFKAGNSQLFDLLGSRQLEPEEAVQISSKVLKEKYVDWWIILFFTGGGLKVGDEESAQDVTTKVGLIDKERNSTSLSHLGQWHEGWGGTFSARFPQIHEKIEHISQWN